MLCTLLMCGLQAGLLGGIGKVCRLKQTHLPRCDYLSELSPMFCACLFAMQEHQNEDLYEKAVSILETYFECEEGDDQNLAPQLAGNQYAFGQAAAAQVRML